MTMSAFVKPINNADPSDGSILLKAYRRGDDWQVIGVKDGEQTVEHWFSVWSDNVDGSLLSALRKTARRYNLTMADSEVNREYSA